MRGALNRAKIASDSIDLISAHATGTPDNDASEHAAMATLLGDRLPTVPVVCFKTQLGHTLGAAGAIELILAAQALNEQTAPARPIVGGSEIEFSDLHLTTASPVPRSIRNTVNTSLGFGGANTSVVMSRVTPLATEGENPSKPLIALSDVCITGIGSVLPGAIGNDALLERWRSREPSEKRDIADSEYEHLLNARRVRRMSPSVKLLLAAATLACRDANLAEQNELLAETGAILGTTHGSAGFSFDYYNQIVREGLLAANPILFAEGVPNVAAAHLSMMLGLKRGCQTIIGTRTAGLDALRFAALRIGSGQIDRVIVAAAEERHGVVDRAYEACNLKRRADRPLGVPLANEFGFESSPGSVAIILESRQSAMQRGATILATIAAVDSIWSEPAKLARSISTLLKRNANLWTSPVDVLLGSANATWIDRVERAAIQSLPNEESNRPTLENAYALAGETFSVTALAALAATILDWRSMKQTSSSGTATALCSDWAGSATIVAIRPEVLHAFTRA